MQYLWYGTRFEGKNFLNPSFLFTSSIKMKKSQIEIRRTLITILLFASFKGTFDGGFYSPVVRWKWPTESLEWKKNNFKRVGRRCNKNRKHFKHVFIWLTFSHVKMFILLITPNYISSSLIINTFLIFHSISSFHANVVQFVCLCAVNRKDSFQTLFYFSM